MRLLPQKHPTKHGNLCHVQLTRPGCATKLCTPVPSSRSASSLNSTKGLLEVERRQGDCGRHQHEHNEGTRAHQLPDTADLEVMILKILVWE